MVFVDEFFIYRHRKINCKNDIIWAVSVNDIPDDLRYNKHPRKSLCIGICVALSSLGIWYDIKEKGQSWDGAYFRSDIIPNIDDWTLNNENVPDPNLVIVQHDCCPGWKALASQQLLVDTFGGDHFIPGLEREDNVIPKWPGNSPDMNPVENLGSIMMDKTNVFVDRCRTKIDTSKLIQLVERAINEVSEMDGLFENLVNSFRTRCQDVLDGGGRPLKY
jgi:hypothetical protein